MQYGGKISERKGKKTGYKTGYSDSVRDGGGQGLLGAIGMERKGTGYEVY